MSTNTRIFPRYDTENMKMKFQSSEGEENDFVVQNVSLGGIQITTPKPTKFEPSFDLSLKLGSQEFSLKAITVWNQAYPTNEDASFNYGFRLIFSEEDHYKRWVTFMKALHQHQKNQKSKSS